jgi:tRNA(His) 5'-end guanylyltransferase
MMTDDLDGRMRAFEAAMGPCVLPGVWMVARLDERNFTRMTDPFSIKRDRNTNTRTQPRR